jgi:hypothetical protein
MRSVALAAALALLSSTAIAADAGALADAGAPAPSAQPSAARPPGHPTAEQSEEEMFRAPADTAEEDDRLPAGTIVAELRDENERPLPGAGLTFAILQQSVAKGESRKHVPAVTNEAGLARLDGNETGSNVAYRVSSVRDGATYAARPFQLPLTKGMHVVLHVYPATSDVDKAVVVGQGILAVEVKDDRIQISQLITVFNAGRVAWVPKDVVLPLPATSTAFRANQGMSDVGVDSVPGGIKLRGTFGPGRNDIEFSWQLPYSGTESFDFTVGMPPHMAAFRVLATASPGMSLVVDDFPAARTSTDNQGQRMLTTQKEARRSEDEIHAVHVRVAGLPTRGPAPFVVAGLCALVLLAGFGLWGRRTPSEAARRELQEALLRELEDLEQAHASGDVGPKTYERVRRELVDALARTLRLAP